MNFQDWWTNNNNPSLPQSEYLFGARHIIMVSVAILAVIILSIIFYKKSEKAKKNVLTVLVSILLFFEIVSRIVNLIITTDYSWQNILKILLPMHICSVAVVIVIIGYFMKNETLINFASIVGLLSTVAFLLYPAVGINKMYISFTCLYSIVSHMIGFITSILLIRFGIAKFEFKKMWKTYLCFAIMFAWGALVDFIIIPGSDYMYLRNNPLDFNLGIPYHIIYACILIVYIFMFYLISYFTEKIKRKSIQNNKNTLE